MIDAVTTNPSPSLDNHKKAKNNTTDSAEVFQGVLSVQVMSISSQTNADMSILDSSQTGQLPFTTQGLNVLAMLHSTVELPDQGNTLINVSDEPLGLMISENNLVELKNDHYVNDPFLDGVDITSENEQALQFIRDPIAFNPAVNESVLQETDKDKTFYKTDILKKADEVPALSTSISKRDLRELLKDNPIENIGRKTEVQSISSLLIKNSLNRPQGVESDRSADEEYLFSEADLELSRQPSDNELELTYSSINLSAGKPATGIEHTLQNPAVLDTEGSFVHELLDTIKYSVKENRSELEIQLKPEHLGRLVLRVSMDEGVLAARLTVESSNMRDFLNSQLKDLRSTLSSQGFSLSHLDVDVGSRQSFSERYPYSFTKSPTTQEQDALPTVRDAAFRSFDYPSKGGFNAFV